MAFSLLKGVIVIKTKGEIYDLFTFTLQLGFIPASLLLTGMDLINTSALINYKF